MQYSRRFVADPKTNYLTKQEAMRIIEQDNSGFLYWVNSTGVETILIGKVSLIRKDDVLETSRQTKHPKSRSA